MCYVCCCVDAHVAHTWLSARPVHRLVPHRSAQVNDSTENLIIIGEMTEAHLNFASSAMIEMHADREKYAGLKSIAPERRISDA